MRTVCLYFQLHQPIKIRKYRFFDIGNDHYYWDDYGNKSHIRRLAERCYLPANFTMLELIKENGKKFKIAYSISGSLLEQLEKFAPDVISSFKMLADTGCVEFLAETDCHSLASLKNKTEFLNQIKSHCNKIESLFGQKPKVLRNTELIYSDQIGEDIAELGFKAMITEGAKNILGWKSPNYLYCNAVEPKLKVLLRNFRLSEDISQRFSNKAWSEWPVTAEKFAGWINALDNREEIINVFLDYETIGENHSPETGIFEFVKALPFTLFRSGISFSTPSEIASNFDPVSAVHASYPISWADEERDLTAWLGNELQDDAFNCVYKLAEKVYACNDPEILRDWRLLQTSDHFYYMCTKWFTDDGPYKYFNPFPSPYDAYINYMNVLSDFTFRLDRILGMKENGEVSVPVKEEKKQESKSTSINLAGKKPAVGSKKKTTGQIKSKVVKNTKTSKAEPKATKKEKTATKQKAVVKKSAAKTEKSTSAKSKEVVKSSTKSTKAVKKTNSAKKAVKTTPAKSKALVADSKKVVKAKVAKPIAKAKKVAKVSPAKKSKVAGK